MANTKSAERRTRANERKRLHNRSIMARVRKAEKAYQAAKTSGNKDETAKALRVVTTAYDVAAKKGTVKKTTANRKKSRLAIQLNKLK